MSIEFRVWPPGSAEALRLVARELEAAYGTAQGPVRERILREARALPSVAAMTGTGLEELVDFVCADVITPLASAELAGRPFGPARPDDVVEWPTGPYRRCAWNPLHLVNLKHETECLICANALSRETTLAGLLERPVPGLMDSLDHVLVAARDRRFAFSPGLLAGTRLVKVHSDSRTWLLDVHDDGTCTESPIDEDSSWEGEWGCDSHGLLVLAVGGYQLAVMGYVHGLCAGLEFRGTDSGEPEPTGDFRVGVVATTDRPGTAVKWTAKPSTFEVICASGDSWVEDGPLEEFLLFAGRARESTQLVRENARGRDFDVRSWEHQDRVEYLTAMHHDQGEDAVWRGVEYWISSRGDVGQTDVVLVGIRSFD